MDRYEATTLGRQRRKGSIERRGTRTGGSPLGVFFFGLPFVGAGLAIFGIGQGWIEVDPRKIHAPLWVLAAIGAVFAAAGCFVWAMAWMQLQARRRQVRARRERPGEPAFEDRAWDPRGTVAPRWSRALKALAAALAVSLFLAVFNWVAFVATGSIFFKIIVCFFDLIAVYAWWETGRRVLLALRFRGAWLAYARFPYSLDEPVVLRWRPPESLDLVDRGSFRLCCVEEYAEVRRRSNGERDQTWVQEELWTGTWHLEEARQLGYGESLELAFEPPREAPGTSLHGERAVFWELVVQLQRPGLDFDESYLVPVYPSPVETEGSASVAEGEQVVPGLAEAGA